VQNQYNLAHRDDDALIDALAEGRDRLCAVLPAGRVQPAAVDALSRSPNASNATPMQVALAWLLRRSPNILLIPGTSSVAHLRENLAAAELVLPDEVMAELESGSGRRRGLTKSVRLRGIKPAARRPPRRSTGPSAGMNIAFVVVYAVDAHRVGPLEVVGGGRADADAVAIDLQLEHADIGLADIAA
jgi:hypothetical protein